MTMHLLPAFVTTTKMSGKRKKVNPKLAKAQAEHEAWLNSQITSKGGKKHVNPMPDYRTDSPNYPSLNTLEGNTARKAEMTYCGERTLLGIATMHKSNMVPVFAENKQVAVEIATMRRG